jgi:hypothetical protein
MFTIWQCRTTSFASGIPAGIASLLFASFTATGDPDRERVLFRVSEISAYGIFTFISVMTRLSEQGTLSSPP